MRKHQSGISTVLIIALIGALAIILVVLSPLILRHLRYSKTTEAMMNVRKLFDSSVSYYESDHENKNENIIPRQFPESVGFTPDKMACDGDSPRAHKSSPEMWSHPTWKALDFKIDEGQKFYFSYKYESTGAGEGASFTITAQGDLNCNGKYEKDEVFERSAIIEDDALINYNLFHQNELE
ncbi:hypothetical protein KKF91_10245 [Myxococcota bacterium]|nr:hypothetical protein [Myxococcota bacterium]MBU1430914.1 hypothetical protein [Myxococcota bacterium]MBU1898311.1 hypothetical protein [Myxococcota bacterium]